MNARRALIAVLATTALAPPAASETLQDALAAAYRSNPSLQGQRLQQRALDETYVQARAGWRPNAQVSAQAQYDRGPNSTDFSQGFSASNSGSAALTVSQPLYTGGRTTWAVRAAEASVMAGRQDLRGVEADVLMSVIQACADVVRDQQILVIRQADVATLERQEAESAARYRLGQATRTDVAQADAQLEAAHASLAAAQGQLEISRAEFQAAVGEKPGELAAPDQLPGLPASVDEAFELAEAANPALQQSRYKEASSRAQVAEAKAAWFPQVAVQGSYGALGPVAPFQTRDYGAQATAALTLTLPLDVAGVTGSQVRQAAAQNGSDAMQIEVVRRQVVLAVAQAWSQLLAGNAEVKAGEAQTAAAQIALKGAQAEYGFGLRTTLDVLISDENLIDAQLALAQSRHDALMAQAAVLAASGRLDARHLLPAEPIIDPARNFDRVKNAGAPPWEGVVSALDGIAAPGDGR